MGSLRQSIGRHCWGEKVRELPLLGHLGSQALSRQTEAGRILVQCMWVERKTHVGVTSVGTWVGPRKSEWLKRGNMMWLGLAKHLEQRSWEQKESQRGEEKRAGKGTKGYHRGQGTGFHKSMLSRKGIACGENPFPSPSQHTLLPSKLFPTTLVKNGISLVQFVFLNSTCRNINQYSLLRGQVGNM